MLPAQCYYRQQRRDDGGHVHVHVGHDAGLGHGGVGGEGGRAEQAQFLAGHQHEEHGALGLLLELGVDFGDFQHAGHARGVVVGAVVDGVALHRGGDAEVVEVGRVHHILVAQLGIGARDFAHHVVALNILVRGLHVGIHRNFQGSRSRLTALYRGKNLGGVQPSGLHEALERGGIHGRIQLLPAADGEGARGRHLTIGTEHAVGAAPQVRQGAGAGRGHNKSHRAVLGRGLQYPRQVLAGRGHRGGKRAGRAAHNYHHFALHIKAGVVVVAQLGRADAEARKSQRRIGHAGGGQLRAGINDVVLARCQGHGRAPLGSGRKRGAGLEKGLAQAHFLNVGAALAGRLHAQAFQLLGHVINGHLVAGRAGRAALQLVVGQVGNVGFDISRLHLLKRLLDGDGHCERRLRLGGAR